MSQEASKVLLTLFNTLVFLCALPRETWGCTELGYLAGVWVGPSLSASQHQPSRLVKCGRLCQQWELQAAYEHHSS